MDTVPTIEVVAVQECNNRGSSKLFNMVISENRKKWFGLVDRLSLLIINVEEKYCDWVGTICRLFIRRRFDW